MATVTTKTVAKLAEPGIKVQRRLASRDVEVTPEAEEVHDVADDVSYSKQVGSSSTALPSLSSLSSSMHL
jgi:hypothetical protein